MPTLPYPLLKREVQLLKSKYLPECPTNELGGYEQVPITDAEVEAIQQNQPAWRVSWLGQFLKNKLHYLAAPQELRIDPTFCPMKRRRNWDTFQRVNSSTRVTWLNYPVLPEPKQGRAPTEKYMVDTLTGVIHQLKGVPDLTCIMLVKIAKILVTTI